MSWLSSIVVFFLTLNLIAADDISVTVNDNGDVDLHIPQMNGELIGDLVKYLSFCWHKHRMNKRAGDQLVDCSLSSTKYVIAKMGVDGILNQVRMDSMQVQLPTLPAVGDDEESVAMGAAIVYVGQNMATLDPTNGNSANLARTVVVISLATVFRLLVEGITTFGGDWTWSTRNTQQTSYQLDCTTAPQPACSNIFCKGKNGKCVSGLMGGCLCKGAESCRKSPTRNSDQDGQLQSNAH